MHPISTVARKWPFANGSGRILDKFAKGIDLGSGVKIAQTSDGIPMQVYCDDLIGRHILLSGKFDRSIVQMLLDHARPRDLLCDVGANIGYVSACFLANVMQSEVICIEPQPGIVDLLGKNMEQFGRRAQVINTALSDRQGTMNFHVNETNRGASGFADDGEIEVMVTCASELLSSFPKMNLLKIDVEGHEEPIFRSIETELKRLRPRAILFEDQTGEASANGAIGSILSRVGYRIFGIQKRLFRTQLVQVWTPDECRFNDYLALAE